MRSLRIRFLVLGAFALISPFQAVACAYAGSGYDVAGGIGDCERECWARYGRSTSPPASGVIVEEAFRVPCPELIDIDFVASLQRALLARGYDVGPISGQVGGLTKQALRDHQRKRGFDSPILTLETARALGLVATCGRS